MRHKCADQCLYDESTDSNGNTPQLGANGLANRVKLEVEQLQMPRSQNFHINPTNDVVYLAPLTPAKVLSSFTDLRSVVGVNPIGNPEDYINFYEGYSSIILDPELLEESNNGPFSWPSIVRVDPGLSLLWNFMLDIKPSALNGVLPSVYTRSVVHGKDQTQLRVLDRIRKQSVQKFDPKNLGLHWRNLPLGLTFNDPNSHREDVGYEERLLGILPKKAIIWLHINRFFRLLYPFFPYLDELQFRDKVRQIFGGQEFDNTKATLLNLTGRMDNAYIGILCLLLRLSYLSLISNDKKSNQEIIDLETDNTELLEVQLMLTSPIGIEFVDFARNCLNEYQVCNRSNLVVLQLLVFMRIYMELSPEDSEGPARDLYQVNNGVLLQMAYLIGLNREPDKMADALNDPRTNNVRRKIWTFIQFRDAVNSLKFGSPFISAAFASDTKFPFLDSTNRNCETEGIDEIVHRSFQPLAKLLPLMKNAIRNVLQIDKGTLIVELLQNLNQLEVYLFENYGTIKDFNRIYLDNNPRLIEKLLHLPYYVPIQIFILSVYFRLYLYYEHTNNLLAFFYCKKLLVIITQECLPFTSDMLDKPHAFFGYACQLVLNPQVEYFLHRLVGFLGAFTVRLGNQIVAAKTRGVEHEPRYMKLKFFMRVLSRSSKACLLGIHKLNHRYCYAWRIATTFTYIVRLLVSEGFYEKVRPRTEQQVLEINFDDAQVRDLIDQFQPLMDSLDLSRFGSYWSVVHDVIQLGKPGKEKLFNPMTSKVVFEGLPPNINDLDIRPRHESPGDIGIDPLWFPVFDPKDVSNVMGTFFEGPELYFEAFNNLSANQLMDNYGMGGMSL